MSAARNSQLVLAPAKINLTLDLLGRRADGYHDLRSVFLALDLCDRLQLRCDSRQAESLSLSVSGPAATPDIPTDGHNLVMSAAQRVLTRLEDLGAPALPPIRMELEKHVPSQSGLGGGSSDAAATVLGLQAIAGRDLGREWRAHTLGELGSDCVFFAVAVDGAAVCEGRGIQVAPLVAPRDWNVALVVPDVHCSTANVFAAVNASDQSEESAEDRTLLGLRAMAARSGARNGLELPAQRAEPLVGAWRDLLDEAGLEHFRMSGSGSAFFGLYEDPEEAHWELAALGHLAQERGLPLRLLQVTGLARHGAQLEAGRGLG